MKKNNRYYPYLFLLLSAAGYIFITSCGKKKPDEKTELIKVTTQLDNVIQRATLLNEAGRTTEALRYLDSGYREAGHVNTADQFEYYKFYYSLYERTGEMFKAEHYVDSALNLIEQSGTTNTLASQYAEANFSKADHLFEEGNYNEAYEYYYKAKNVAEINSDSCTLGYYNYKIGLVLYKGEKYKEAIPYFEQAFNEVSTCNAYVSYFYRLQELYDNIGLCYYNMNIQDSAIVYYTKALNLIQDKRSNYPQNKARLFDAANAVIFGNMGSAYEAIGKYKQAEDLYLQSIEINDKPTYDRRDALLTKIKLAELYLEQNRLAEGDKLLREVRITQDSLKSMAVELRWQNIVWQYFEKKNEPREAFRALSKYNYLRDSIATSNRQAQHMDIDQRVINLQREDQINVLEKRNALRTIYLVIAGMFCTMLAAIILLVIYNSRKSKKNVEQLTELNAKMNEQQVKLQGVLAELERSDKEKDRILKAVSHDMRSPVNSALALTDLVLMDEQTTEEQKEYLNLIKNSCANALNLTKDLLEVATLHTEKISKTDTDIKELLRTNIELLKFRAADKKQGINLKLPADDIILHINAEKIIRVVNNIIGNAIKFSPPYTNINVGMTKAEKGVTISIQDSGIGIPDTMKERVFDIFTEAKRFGTSGEEPYGLGLSISKQIVEVHGGKIWFDSEVGQGTTFHIFLPA